MLEPPWFCRRTDVFGIAQVAKLQGACNRIWCEVDVHTTEQRSRNMSRVRAKNTRPELLLGRALHAAGLRYRLHAAKLPGRPDLVFPARRAVIFVHGCFWHGHECPRFQLPATRTVFWREKIEENHVRDARVAADLRGKGWRIFTVWECSLRGPVRRPLPVLVERIKNFLDEHEPELTRLEVRQPRIAQARRDPSSRSSRNGPAAAVHRGRRRRCAEDCPTDSPPP